MTSTPGTAPVERKHVKPGPLRRAPTVRCGAARHPSSAAAQGAAELALVTTREAFAHLEAEWNDLFARAGRGTQLFQTFGWCWHWYDHYRDSAGTLAIVTARRDGRLVLAWPLVSYRRAGVRILAAAGNPVSQYSDALIDCGSDADGLLAEAWSKAVGTLKPDLVWLPHVRDDAAIAPFVSTLGGLVTQRLTAPYLDLASAADLTARLQRQSPRSRKKQRAAARRLAKLGAVQFTEHRQGPAAGTLATAAIDMKRRQLAARGTLSPAYADARLAPFFAGAAGDQRHAAGMRVFALECDGANAAIDILVACKDRIATHVLAYDPAFGRDSVGTQLLHHAIESAAAEGLRTFDLMAPADGYKLRIADGTVAVVDWAIPLSAKGAAFARLCHVLARPMLKRAAAALPASVRRLAGRYLYRRYLAS